MTDDGLFDDVGDDGLGYCELPGLASWTPVSDVIGELQVAHDLPQMTGGSGAKGWSAYGTFERCPYAYYLLYIAEKLIIEGEEVTVESVREHRDIGTLFHAFACLRYWGQINTNRLDDDPACTPEWLRDKLLEKCNPETVNDSWRIFQSYEYRYTDDYLIPIAVEETHVVAGNKSCRYDLVARITKSIEGFEPGIFIVEHKTASRFTEDLLTGWDLDGEILGEIALWALPGPHGEPSPEKKFGPLKGVIVNIVGKQKVPKFYRALISPQSFMTKRHLRVLNHLDARIEEHRRLKYWPQHFAGCTYRYGKCDYWDYCLNEGIRG